MCWSTHPSWVSEPRKLKAAGRFSVPHKTEKASVSQGLSSQVRDQKDKRLLQYDLFVVLLGVDIYIYIYYVRKPAVNVKNVSAWTNSAAERCNWLTTRVGSIPEYYYIYYYLVYLVPHKRWATDTMYPVCDLCVLHSTALVQTNYYFARRFRYLTVFVHLCQI